MDINEYIRNNWHNMTDNEMAAVCGISRKAIEGRRERMGLKKDKKNKPIDAQVELITKVAELLARNNISPDEVGRIQKIRVSNSQMGYVDRETGEADIKDLTHTSFVFTPKWQEGPEWPIVQQAKPTIVKPAKVAQMPREGQVAVILPDVQIGYRRDVQTAELSAFHDEQAMSVALQIIKDLQPDLIVNLGDFLDFPMFGKYTQEAGFALTAQASIDKAHLFLAEQRAAAFNAKIVVIEGNHEKRLKSMQSITMNSLAAMHLQKANLPDSWPVMSVPFLCRFDELDIEYIDAYPAGEYWINDRLVCIHGYRVAPAGKTAARVVNDERVSTIFGHIHRIELAYKTMRVRAGSRINLSFSPGCLCRIDGAVPSTKSGSDIMGRPLVSYENWQQGIGIVHYEEGDAPFSVTPVFIHDGYAIVNGKHYKA